MQTHIPLTEDNVFSIGEPKLLYASKLEGNELKFPRNTHSHEFLEIVYILRGQSTFEISNNKYPVKAGDTIIYNSGVVHYENASSENPPILCCAGTGIMVTSLRRDCLISDEASPVIHTGSYSTIIKNIMESIFEAAIWKVPRAHEICNSLYGALLQYIIMLSDENSNSIEDIKIDTKKTSAEILAKNVRDHVDSLGHQDIIISELAESFGVSESYLARVFKKHYSCSLSTYIIRRKMGEAQTLLLTTKLSINDIAKKLGYDNQSYFAKQFTQTIGIPPLRYRKRNTIN